MRDACGDEIVISGLDDFVEIAIPLQRAAYTEAQWERIENPPPPSAAYTDGDGSCAPAGGATAHEHATTSHGNTTALLDNATSLLGNAKLPDEEGSGAVGTTPCAPGGCITNSDCGGHGDCRRSVCECDLGFLGANCSVVATCRFWDNAAAAWSENGCVKADTPGGPRRTDGFVHCRCNLPKDLPTTHLLTCD